jgi:hypothetical protein
MFRTKVVEKIKTHILRSVIFFPENRAVYEIMWENIVERGRPQMIIWRMRTACWIPKATDTNLEYVNSLLFHYNNGFTNAPQCYVIRTLSVLSNCSVLQVNAVWMFLFTLCLVCIGMSFWESDISTGCRRTRGLRKYFETEGENGMKIEKISMWVAS